MRRKQYRAEWWTRAGELPVRLGQVHSSIDELLDVRWPRCTSCRTIWRTPLRPIPSGFDRAAILTIDGTARRRLLAGEASHHIQRRDVRISHSIGFLWEVFSGYLGFSHYTLRSHGWRLRNPRSTVNISIDPARRRSELRVPRSILF